ncbi:hypothetical protein TNCV_1758101 [Trichonephila clavipes]|nr:hypothetical protein TNCV_1758101 [Trichonephila clavipes]
MLKFREGLPAQLASVLIKLPCFKITIFDARGPIFFQKETTATAGSDVVQSGRTIFDDFFQHLWPYVGNNTANVVFQMVKRLWLIRIDQ